MRVGRDGYLKAVTSPVEPKFAKRMGGVGAALEGFSDEQVMQAIEAQRSGQDASPQPKIKEAEFELLTCGQPTIGKNEHDSVFYAEEYPKSACGKNEHDSVFYAEEYPKSAWNEELTKRLQRVVIVHRLREVTALVGYTRFDYISPDIDGEYDLNLEPARLGINANWIPTSENKSEGLFLQFQKESVDEWKERPAVKKLADSLERGLRNWCDERDIKPRLFFGAPYVMLYSLSHMLINAISLECGYPASSIKERIYANPKQGYGILLYTAGADSYGTLGGLASAARSFDHFLKSALEVNLRPSRFLGSAYPSGKPRLLLRRLACEAMAINPPGRVGDGGARQSRRAVGRRGQPVEGQWSLAEGVLPAARNLRPGAEQLALQVTVS
jgi:hypothetical protein